MQVIPGATPIPTSTGPSEGAKSARERAISMLSAKPSAPSAQPTPVPNPTSVAPEEMGAIRQSTTTKDAQAPASESAIEDTKAAPAEDKVLSSEYAVLARKEKALRQRDRDLKDRESAIRAQEEALKPKAPSFDESKYIAKDKLTQDPFSVLAELGLTYDQLTNLALNAPSPEQRAQQDYLKKLESKIADLESAQSKTNKSFEEQQVQSRQQAVNQIKAETTKLVTSDPAFETIKETGSIDDVVELIEKTFDSDGVLLSVEEAAQMVEDYLVEEAMKIAKIKKIQQRLMPKQEALKPSTEASAESPQLKTLTNSVSSTRQLSARERALLAFEGKLK